MNWANDVINNYQFSPDGTAVYANYDNDKTARLIPSDGSLAIELGQGDVALVGWANGWRPKRQTTRAVIRFDRRPR